MGIALTYSFTFVQNQIDMLVYQWSFELQVFDPHAKWLNFPKIQKFLLCQHHSLKHSLILIKGIVRSQFSAFILRSLIVALICLFTIHYSSTFFLPRSQSQVTNNYSYKNCLFEYIIYNGFLDFHNFFTFCCLRSSLIILLSTIYLINYVWT